MAWKVIIGNQCVTDLKFSKKVAPYETSPVLGTVNWWKLSASCSIYCRLCHENRQYLARLQMWVCELSKPFLQFASFIQYWKAPQLGYRFSAFWLRSKCSICSYQLNIWYVVHCTTTILNWFLEPGGDAGACSDPSTGWPGIAVPPGSAHFPLGGI